MSGPKLFECEPRPMRPIRRRQPTERHTYGLGRATIPAALANGIALLIGVGAIVREAIERISAPEPVAAATVLWHCGNRFAWLARTPGRR